MARHEIIKTSLRKRDDDMGVSEVLGVIMMLAMVLSIMGGFGFFSTLTSLILKTIPIGTLPMELLTELKTG